MTLIDHVAQLAADPDDAVNELTTLSTLRAGLFTLANQVAGYEQPIRGRKIFFVGFDFGLPNGADDFLPCLFHWFGTSLCNYARLVGFLGGVHSGVYPRHATEDPGQFKLIESHCTNYVESVPELEPVLLWRNKVFAHFAITAPRKQDNAALLDVSVMSPICVMDGRFSVGGLTMAIRGAEVSMPQWSMTRVFESLEARYWPSLKLQ
jgi:hypothetical protein